MAQASTSGADHGASRMETTEHAKALAALEQGEPEQARRLLHDGLRRAVDPEMLNDLAVVAMRCGDGAEATDLLRALVRLHPEHVAGVENLAALDGRLKPALAADGERRARFLQVVAESMATHLPDNIDYLFEPYGHKLSDPALAGARLEQQLEVLERCGTLWNALGDESSRELLLRFLAYRALGPVHVRLQLDPIEYRRTVIGLSAQLLRHGFLMHASGVPFEWQQHQYDLRSLGLPIQVIGSPLPLASTMAFSQYAYRDAGVPARPRPGDVALDVGGCWGDTALWLAHVVGERGAVHTFEPAPSNRQLLARNLELNPALAPRITVWPDPLGAVPGTRVWIPDVLAAGATIRVELSGDEPWRMIELRTQSVDALVAQRRLAYVDFVKVDVEGADLGVLEGAADTIRNHRPRLAIACYHKPDDLVTIPDFVASLGVRYKWYLQCSTMTDVDTVAFGVPA